MNKKISPTLSIISRCNNQCPYCFQGNEYKNKNEVLSFEEIKKIIQWIKQELDFITIMGGEPLLHPEITDIMQYISKELYACKIITNLITHDSNIIKELRNINNLNWLINTTTDKVNIDIFEQNLKILFQNFIPNENKMPAFSVTLTGNEDLDIQYIENLFKIFKLLPDNIPFNARITPVMPNRNTFKMNNFDKQFMYLLNSIEHNLKPINISFDCGFNFCFVSKNTIKELMKHVNLSIPGPGCIKAPYIDIGTDKKISYCHYVSQEYFPPKYYYNFSKPSEYIQYFSEIKKDFIEKHNFLCKEKVQNINCPKDCPGVCPALASKILENKYISL